MDERELIAGLERVVLFVQERGLDQNRNMEKFLDAGEWILCYEGIYFNREIQDALNQDAEMSELYRQLREFYDPLVEEESNR
jgi:hypothetical protein